VVGDLLDVVIPMFTANLKIEKDPEVRLKFFSLLSRLIMNAPQSLDSQNKFADFAVVVVRDMILPNCVWHAGRVAGAIRTTAVSSLWAILQSGVLDKEKVLVY
jgi:dynein assembly factor 5